MSIATTIALSGINAATLRLQVAGSNIANARSGGYVPLRVNQTETADGGTSATVTEASQGYDLKRRNTEAWDFAANPYVALTNEMVQVLVARFNLAANAHVVRADNQLSAALFDITI